MVLAEGREHLSDGQIALIVGCDAVAQTPQPTIPQGAAA
jgi:hypothetical protein